MVPKVPKDSRHVYWELRDVGIMAKVKPSHVPNEVSATPYQWGKGSGSTSHLWEGNSPVQRGLEGECGAKGAGRQMQMRAGAAFP